MTRLIDRGDRQATIGTVRKIPADIPSKCGRMRLAGVRRSLSKESDASAAGIRRPHGLR